MALFTAYFDASGHPTGQQWMFVAGFVATVEKWERFESEWPKLLRSYAIQSPFHMNEFASSKGQYASWKKETERRHQFIRDAIALIRRNTSKSLSWGIRIRELRDFAKEFPQCPVSHFEPYTFCGFGAYRLLREWHNNRLRTGKRDPFPQMVFEYGDMHRGQMMDTLTDLTKQIPEVLSRGV